VEEAEEVPPVRTPEDVKRLLRDPASAFGSHEQVCGTKGGCVGTNVYRKSKKGRIALFGVAYQCGFFLPLSECKKLLEEEQSDAEETPEPPA